MVQWPQEVVRARSHACATRSARGRGSAARQGQTRPPSSGFTTGYRHVSTDNPRLENDASFPCHVSDAQALGPMRSPGAVQSP